MSRGRLEFDKATKREAYDRHGGVCECGRCWQLKRPQGCGRPTGIANIYYEHINPDAMKLDNSLENCAVLCKTCWQEKTATSDIPTIAKSNRVRDRARGIR
jgi:5-methylcytosine-specific restriction enzyme A